LNGFQLLMLFPPNTTPLRLESRNVRVAFFDEASCSTKPHCQRGHVCMLHTSSPARCICAECRRPLSRLRPAFICDLCAAADWLCGECVTYGEGQDVLQGLSRISYQAELIAPMFQTPTQVNSPTNTEPMNCASKLRRRVAPIQIRRAAFQEETEEGRRRLARASTADAGAQRFLPGEPRSFFATKSTAEAARLKLPPPQKLEARRTEISALSRAFESKAADALVANRKTHGDLLARFLDR
jgi:hypothetical protein